MSEETTHTSVARRSLLLIAKLTVSGVLLALLFSRMDTTRLWSSARNASFAWLIAGLGVYAINIVASTWRWRLLLHAQDVYVSTGMLFRSFLVATFFNNFLPSNIGGDVIRIRDTATAAGSKTLATTIVLVDRGLGLIGLVLTAALSATIAASLYGRNASPIWPSWLWVLFAASTAVVAPAMYSPDGLGRVLRPLTILHPEWVGTRIDTIKSALWRFRERPSAVASCFGGALVVQALIVIFYLAVVRALKIPITPWDLAVIVPLSLVVQMLPISVNGLGLREAAFSFYFTRLGLPIESAVLMSLMGAGLLMLFSLTGAAVYISRGHH